MNNEIEKPVSCLPELSDVFFIGIRVEKIKDNQAYAYLKLYPVVESMFIEDREILRKMVISTLNNFDAFSSTETKWDLFLLDDNTKSIIETFADFKKEMCG